MEPREYEDEVLRRMSPADKLAVLKTLIRQAYELKEAGIRLQQPDLPDAEVRRKARELVGGGRR